MKKAYRANVRESERATCQVMRSNCTFTRILHQSVQLLRDLPDITLLAVLYVWHYKTIRGVHSNTDIMRRLK